MRRNDFRDFGGLLMPASGIGPGRDEELLRGGCALTGLPRFQSGVQRMLTLHELDRRA
jgi:hypothetical protein